MKTKGTQAHRLGVTQCLPQDSRGAQIHEPSSSSTAWETQGSRPASADPTLNCGGGAAEDVAAWPYSVGVLVTLSSFRGSFHWPSQCENLGVGGVSYFELLIFMSSALGNVLPLEKAVPRYLRKERPTSVSAVLLGPGIDIWEVLFVLGWYVADPLRDVPGGLARFLLCETGANHCRLRRVGTMWTRVHVSFSGAHRLECLLRW